jgi:CheY-like chemotaxis protein
MGRVLLIHWNSAEAAERAERIRREGFEARSCAGPGDIAFRAVRENPPDAVVIDLNRLPSHGRQLGVALRQQKATRSIPLVFIKADPEKTARTRELLGDAIFTTWPRIGAAIRRALRQAPQEPVVPGMFAGYTGTPLPKKLRIQAASVVALLNAPEGFEAKLEPLPGGVRLQKQTKDADVILKFCKSVAALGHDLPELAGEMISGRTLWLIWPKKASGWSSDLSEPAVRAMGLGAGLVDYKICAVDEKWSGLAFAVRRARRAAVRP